MSKKLCLRLVLAGALLALLTASVPVAVAADPQSPASPVAPPSVEGQPASSWRRIAFPAALVASGLGIATAVTFEAVSRQRTDEFNKFEAPRCSVGVPDKGGSACAAKFDEVNSALRWRNIAFGAAGAFAVTALVLKLTEPDTGSPTSHARTQLACAPGLGVSATCALTF